MARSLVPVAWFFSIPRAHLALGRLLSSGLPATLGGLHHMEVHWFQGCAAGGVSLLVADSDIDEALDILLADAEPEPETETHAEEPVPSCPTCGSEEVEMRPRLGWLILALLTFTGLGVPLGTRCRCEACGWRGGRSALVTRGDRPEA